MPRCSHGMPLMPWVVGVNKKKPAAEQKGVDLSELLTEVLQRNIEINEALQ